MEERQIESVVFDKRVTRFGVKRKARKDSEKKRKRGKLTCSSGYELCGFLTSPWCLQSIKKEEKRKIQKERERVRVRDLESRERTDEKTKRNRAGSSEV